MEAKNQTNKQKAETDQKIVELVVTRGEGARERGKSGGGEWEVQAPSDGMSKSQGCKRQHREYSG